MKSKKSFDKLRGGYYTPQAITEFICKWIINKNTKNILEPSCGDGNFLKAIVERQEKLNLNLDITGVELCLDEAKKAMRYFLESWLFWMMRRRGDFYLVMKNYLE